MFIIAIPLLTVYKRSIYSNGEEIVVYKLSSI